MPFQNIRSSRLNDDHTDTLFWADVPAMGYAVYWLTGGEGENRTPSMVHIYEEAGAVVLENSRLRAVFDLKAGGLSSLRDTAGVEFLTAPSVPLVIDDHKTDTWAHNVFRFHDVAGQMELVSLDISEEGPLRAAGSEPEASYEIPCGFLRRPCNGEEEPALGWADLSVVGGDGLRRGLTVLSDSKYSWDCPSTEKGAGHGCRASFEGSLLPCPVTVSFGSFECKTLRIEEDGTVREVDFLEGCVS